MTNVAREKIIWKTYPEFPFIEANQFGEVRTRDRIVKSKDGRNYHIKGRILKQHDNGYGYMQVKFKINGKNITRYVHRIVAICFVSNPNGYPEVNHIDNDRKNNSASNLEWCSRKYNEDYKKNFGTSQTQLFGQPVFAVELRTGEVLRFETRAEAARRLGVHHGDIIKVIRGELNQIGGYWFTEDESEITEEKIQEVKDNMRFRGEVIAIRLDDLKTFKFKSQTEAGIKLGISRQSINDVIWGRHSKTHGYWLCRADKNAVEKARVRFGDEVAKKVEELLSERRII